MRHPKAGDIRVLNHPVKYDGESTGIRLLPPDKGANTRDILLEAGYTSGEIDRLRQDGVVVWDDPA